MSGLAGVCGASQPPLALPFPLPSHEMLKILNIKIPSHALSPDSGPTFPTILCTRHLELSIREMNSSSYHLHPICVPSPIFWIPVEDNAKLLSIGQTHSTISSCPPPLYKLLSIKDDQ